MVDVQVARARMQREAIVTALYLVWPKPLGPQLLMEGLAADLTPTRGELERAIYHLRDRGLVAEQGGGTVPLWRLTRAGIDAHEGRAGASTDMVRGVRMLRLRVLDGLEAARPQALGPRLLGMYLNNDEDLDRSEAALRRAALYLAECGLAETVGEDLWRISAAGMDYLAGDGAAEYQGVAQVMDW